MSFNTFYGRSLGLEHRKEVRVVKIPGTGLPPGIILGSSKHYETNDHYHQHHHSPSHHHHLSNFNHQPTSPVASGNIREVPLYDRNGNIIGFRQI